MAANIDTSFIRQFSDNIHMMLEQQGSKLLPFVEREFVTGEKASFERIGSINAYEITGRLQKTELQDPDHSRRTLIIKDYAAPTYLSKEDEIRLLVDPTSAYVRRIANALGKFMDDSIITAAFGNALAGKDGTTSVPLPVGQKVAVDNHAFDSGTGDVGLTVGKLLAARDILMGNEVDPQARLYCVLNSKQMAKLLSEEKSTSGDYVARRNLETGYIENFLGFNFIHSERLGVDSNADDRVLVFAEDALKLGIAQDLNVSIDPRPDLHNALQIMAKGSWGSVRMEEERVVEIACDPS